jgi:hypothetical protein
MKLISTFALPLAVACGVSPTLPAAAPGDVVTVDEPVPPSRTGPISAEACGPHYLPDAPAPIATPFILDDGDLASHASCTALLDGAAGLDVDSTAGFVDGAGHVGGRFYFEATVERFGDGSEVGVRASPWPDDDLDAAALQQTPRPSSDVGIAVMGGGIINAPVSVAVHSLAAPGLISVAADLDAGFVYLFVDGVRSGDAIPISLAPGVGAYAPAVKAANGSFIELNLGQRPFAHAIPAGYRAWASGLRVDDAGACIADDAKAFDRAPITAACTWAMSPLSTFASGCKSELVAISLNQPTDDDANPGTTTIHVARKGHITLGLAVESSARFVVQADDGVVVDHVYVYGWFSPNIEAPGPITIVPVDDAPIWGGVAWPYDLFGGDTQGFVERLENDAGMPLGLYAGCGNSTSFTIN